MIVTFPKKKSSSGGHWYSTSGLPVHTQPDGKNTTLKHARVQNLLPSVTAIIGQLEKPQLTKWKADRCIAKSFECPPKDGEDVKDYKGRIHQLLRDDQSEVLTLGTRVHKAMEDINHGIYDSTKDPDIFPFVEGFIRCQRKKVKVVHDVEGVVVNPRYGYGGTLDLRCSLFGNRYHHPITIIDYKTQNIKPGNKPKFYGEFAYQLAAYRKCFKPAPQCVSIIINSNEPGSPIEKIWSIGEIQAAWRTFKRLCQIWQDRSNYRPEDPNGK